MGEDALGVGEVPDPGLRVHRERRFDGHADRLRRDKDHQEEGPEHHLERDPVPEQDRAAHEQVAAAVGGKVAAVLPEVLDDAAHLTPLLLALLQEVRAARQPVVLEDRLDVGDVLQVAPGEESAEEGAEIAAAGNG